MTALLDHAVAELRRLPTHEQDEIARGLLKARDPQRNAMQEAHLLGATIKGEAEGFRLWPRGSRRR